MTSTRTIIYMILGGFSSEHWRGVCFLTLREGGMEGGTERWGQQEVSQREVEERYRGRVGRRE